MALEPSSSETSSSAAGGSPTAPNATSNGRSVGLRRLAGRIRQQLFPSKPRAGGFGSLDHPPPSDRPFSEPLAVSGWWVFPAGPPRSGYLAIDGVRVTSLLVRQDRPDVAAMFPHVEGSRDSGFAGSLMATRPSANRPIQLDVMLESPDGVVHTVATRRIVLAAGHRGSVEKYPPRNGPHAISGWAFLDHGPVARAWATWNGRPIAELEIGQPRPDVSQMYPALPWSATSGFSGHLDLVGTGDLGVLLEGADGKTVDMEAVPVQSPRAGLGAGVLESPLQGADIVDEEVVVKGWWVFAGGPPRSGFLYVDDKPEMPVDIQLERADIASRPRMQSCFPHASMCGFACRWRPSQNLARGEHRLSIRLESPGGQEIWIGPRSIKLHDVYRGDVHRWPSAESPVVEGWAIFDLGPVYRAFLCVDDKRTIELDVGLPTPEVLNDFSDKPWAAEAGFRGNLPRDVDWCGVNLSVLLVGQMGQQRVLGRRRHWESPAGSCRIAGYGAAFDPVAAPSSEDTHLILTGWAHQSGRPLDRLWISTNELPRWECEVGLERPGLSSGETLGFRAIIPVSLLSSDARLSIHAGAFALQSESEFGSIELIAPTPDRETHRGLTAGDFDVGWSHASDRLIVEFTGRDGVPADRRPRLFVNKIDVSSRVCRIEDAPSRWRYSLITKALDGECVGLGFPDAGDDVEATIELPKRSVRDRAAGAPRPSTRCALLLSTGGEECVWITRRTSSRVAPEVVVMDDSCRPQGRGSLRRTTLPSETADLDDCHVYCGLVPAAGGTWVNIVE
ncbi:MAG: hypothetical protein V3T70_08190, partial [Phycisphaerae bacterium]